MIIAFINQKGGPGKTTSALNTAGYLAARGDSVLLVDANEDQGSVTKSWLPNRIKNDLGQPPFRIAKLDNPAMIHEVMKQAAEFRHVVIDGPPGAAAINRAVIIAADVVVTPCEPGAFSDDAVDKTIEQINEARQIKPTQKSVFLVSKKIGNTVIGRQARENLAQKPQDMALPFDMPVLKTEIPILVAYVEAATLGQTIHEYAPDGQEAKLVTQLAEEILRHAEEGLQEDEAADRAGQSALAS